MYTVIPDAILDQYEKFTTLSCINDRQMVLCAVEYALVETPKTFTTWLSESEITLKASGGKQIQCKISSDLQGKVDRIVKQSSYTQKKFVLDIILYCLDNRHDFDKYVLQNTPSPTFEKYEKPTDIDTIGGMDPDKYMTMDTKSIIYDIEDDISSLTQEKT